RIRPNFKNTVKEIWKLYAVFSFVGFILLYLLGLDFFDALNYAMSALPTSGLGINSAGLSGLDNVLAELVIAFLMFLGATNFLVFYLFFKKGNASAFRNDPEFRTLIILIIFSTLLVSPKLIQFYGSEFQGIYVGFFTTVSAISEGGFQNTPISDTAAWDDFVKLVLVGLMIIGGGTASTSGGLKLSRFILSIKSLQWKIKGLFLPRGAFFKKQFEGTSIEEEKLKEINHFIILYAFGIIGGVMILTSQGFPLNNALFEVASAQGNAGLSSGITSIGMPFLSKITLIANMLIGRLEFIPFIAAAGFGLSFLRKA
ncbi:MAG: TrkH family potassium uptake protein, partial [Candidatus Diapherotrites archaeon]|nr:TrkH family potassium uptake protein [Candidatus Diapherotrites archaeon]